MLARMRDNVRARREPTYSAYLAVLDPTNRIGPPLASIGSPVWLANLSYVPHPQPLWVVNASLSPGTRWLSNKEDALAAWTHALLWAITEDRRHADKAVQIMDAWSAMLADRAVSGADGLEVAWSGTGWARAAEIIRHTTASGVWPPDRVRRFERMLSSAYLPWVDAGASTNGNIAFVMSEAYLHIGVFTDNRTAVDAAVALWRQQAPAYVYLTADGPTPRRPPTQRYLPNTGPVCGPDCDDAQIENFWHGDSNSSGHDGVAQETCRDLGHTNMLLSAMVNFAETAYHQGIDLYAESRARILAASEFQASMMADEPAPFRRAGWPAWLCGGRCRGEHCGAVNGSTLEMVHHHYVARLNGSAAALLPNTTALLRHMARPTSCFDQLCWETLTHGDLLL
eukprot:g7342.t1